MFDVIKRVISGEDVGEGKEPSESAVEDRVMEDGATPSATTDLQPVLVENDTDQDGMGHNQSTTDDAVDAGSSLSDVSDTNIEEMDSDPNDNNNYIKMVVDDDGMLERSNAIPAQIAAMFPHGQFPRHDSRASNDSSSGSQRASSQNSSRDWGWFEDVHGSDNATSPYLKRKDATEDKHNSKKGKKSGLVQQAKMGPSSRSLNEILHSSLGNDVASMAVTAPNYVLEESLSSQRLWKDTAGNRPPQPMEERAFFEKMWSQNFARSQVQYQMPVDVLTATSPISLSPFADGNFDSARADDLSSYNMSATQAPRAEQDVAEATLMSRLHDSRANDFSAKAPVSHSYQQTVINQTVKGYGADGDLTVLVKGDNVFGTTVSKSFARTSDNGGPIVGVDTVNISVASYRVVQSKKIGKYAQFLVIYREGSIRDTIGVWKRYSDFVELSKKVTKSHEGCAAVIANMSPLAVTEEHEVEHLPNAITSWRLLKKRQRWYRCLDAGYLSLKVFLLERFLHDILFESSNPNLLREFVGTDEYEM